MNCIWQPLTSGAAVPPQAVLGITQCPRPEHAGTEGAMALFCPECKVPVCGACLPTTHAGHRDQVVSVVAAADAAAPTLAEALPVLSRGVAQYRAVAAEAARRMRVVQADGAVAVQQVHARYRMLKAALKAQRDAQLADIAAFVGGSIALLERAGRDAVACMADLRCGAECAERALVAVVAPHAVLQACASAARYVEVAKRVPSLPNSMTVVLSADSREAVFPVGVVTQQAEVSFRRVTRLLVVVGTPTFEHGSCSRMVHVFDVLLYCSRNVHQWWTCPTAR
jgi:hypothetical protein